MRARISHNIIIYWWRIVYSYIAIDIVYTALQRHRGDQIK